MSDSKKAPKHWGIKKLGEVCTIIMGQSPPSSTYNTDGIGLPFFQGKAEFTELHPVAKKWCNSPNKIAEPNDILISVRAPVGATNIANQRCCIGRGLAAIRYENNKFVYYFLRSIEKHLDKKGTGTTFKAISGEIIKTTEMPFPSFIEQQKIVAKIEELFSELEKGKEQLEFSLKQLKVYRQSVLKWAFEGRLTKKNVKKGQLPNGWKWVKLKEIAKEITDGDHQAPPKSNTGIPFITISNIDKLNNKIDFSETFLVDRAYFQNLKGNRRPIKGDVLYTVTGSFGIPVLVDFEKDFCFQRHIGLIRPLENINYVWLYYLLQSPLVYEQATKTATGTAQKTVALNSLRNFDIPQCSIDEQNFIVQELERRLTVCAKIEETISESLQQAETLRQSILKKAFEGRLI